MGRTRRMARPPRWARQDRIATCQTREGPSRLSARSVLLDPLEDEHDVLPTLGGELLRHVGYPGRAATAARVPGPTGRRSDERGPITAVLLPVDPAVPENRA